MTGNGLTNDVESLRRDLLAAAWPLRPEHWSALAALCEQIATGVSDPPACWPRRCAGPRPRLGIVVDLADSGRGRAWFARKVLEQWRNAESPSADLALLVPTPRLPADLVDGLRHSGIGAVAFGGAPAAVVARTISELDLDLIVDLAGLRRETAEMLARRPARTLVAAALGAPPYVPPVVDWLLVDRDAKDAAASVVPEDHLLVLDPAGAEFPTLLSVLLARLTRPSAHGDCPIDARALKALWQQALRAHQAGDHPGARGLYGQVVAMQPDSAAARLFCGRLLAAMDVLNEAESHLRRAHDLAPQWQAAQLALAETRQAMGLAHQKAGDLEAAAAAFEEAAALDPANEAALYNAATANAAQGRTDGAVVQFERLIERAPSHVLAHKNLCEALQAAGRFEAWVAAFSRFESSCPKALSMAVHALEACQYQGNPGRAERYIGRIAAGEFQAHDRQDEVDTLEQLLYLLLFFDVEPEVLLQFYRAYDAAARRAYPEALRAVATRAPGRIRIGYVSADLRDHVMGKMMWEAVSRHDRSRFEIVCYSIGDREDDWTRRYEAVCDRFERLARVDDAAAVERIAAADIDVLVDLNTHTKGARPAIFAAKPARVAIVHVASGGSLGLAAVDFKLTDALADPPENQAFLLERLLPMDGCVYPFRRIRAGEGDRCSRAALGIADGAFVIGAFVTLLKLSTRCLALWREILERIPEALIAFSPSHPAAAQCYAQLLEGQGIGRDRLVFIPQQGDECANQARYACVDIVLDPMPFGGVNGTMEALAMGRPVVTLRGRKHQERTGYSMLVNLDVPELVAGTPEQYVAIAVRLARDVAFRRRVHEKIAEGLRASALVDTERYTRNLEAAYVRALAARGFRM